MEHLSPCSPFRTLGVPGRFYVEQPLLFPDFLICISRSSPALALDPTLPPSFLIQLSHYHLLASGFSTPGVGFPGSSAGKESTCNAGDLGLIPGLGRSPGGGHGNPLQYSYLENPMDRIAWWDTVHGVLQTRILEWVAIPTSRGSSQPRDLTQTSCITDGSFTAESLGKPSLHILNTIS